MYDLLFLKDEPARDSNFNYLIWSSQFARSLQLMKQQLSLQQVAGWKLEDWISLPLSEIKCGKSANIICKLHICCARKENFRHSNTNEGGQGIENDRLQQHIRQLASIVTLHNHRFNQIRPHSEFL